MSKLYTYISCILIVFTLALLSCEKLEIPNDELANIENKGKDDNGGNDNNGGNNDNRDLDENDIPDDVYSVSYILNGECTQTENVYVVGYIVGYVKNTSMDFCHFSRGDVETNIIIADIPIETNPDKCIPVQLTNDNTSCKETREALNLAKNDVLGQKVRLQGDIGNYMKSKHGLLKARKHVFLENDFDEDEYKKENGDDGDGDSSGNDDDPDDKSSDIPNDEDENGEDENQDWDDLVTYINSHGTEEAPFTITDFKTTLPEYLSHYGDQSIGQTGMNNVYICGYIVGYIPKGNKKMDKTVFSNEGASETNIILADFPDEHDHNNCIAVELSTSSTKNKNVREALNLSDHPENYKKRFIIYGNINTYMGVLGLKSTREYVPCYE